MTLDNKSVGLGHPRRTFIFPVTLLLLLVFFSLSPQSPSPSLVRLFQLVFFLFISLSLFFLAFIYFFSVLFSGRQSDMRCGGCNLPFAIMWRSLINISFFSSFFFFFDVRSIFIQYFFLFAVNYFKEYSTPPRKRDRQTKRNVYKRVFLGKQQHLYKHF